MYNRRATARRRATVDDMTFRFVVAAAWAAEKPRRRRDFHRFHRLTTTKGRQRYDHKIPGLGGGRELAVWARLGTTAAGLLPCGRHV